MEKRNTIRYKSIARARMPGLFEGDALLKDLSITGCCIECTTQIDVAPDIRYTLQVTPESTAKIGNFELAVEMRWVRSEGGVLDIGFMVVASPKGKLFQRYVDYLAWRADQSAPAPVPTL